MPCFSVSDYDMDNLDFVLSTKAQATGAEKCWSLGFENALEREGNLDSLTSNTPFSPLRLGYLIAQLLATGSSATWRSMPCTERLLVLCSLEALA